MVEVETPFLRGRWRVGTFSDKVPHKRRYETDTDGQQPPRSTKPASLAEWYAVLGISMDAEEEDVKTAYRNLARKIHPDVNKAPDATAQMQALNEAYRRLMATFDDD
ncbi:MAG: DnaJ domain-containing protein [Anaerolineaceae bacterium]|nr:DnaJ domain-containing protein [Anaerolineaceae bacterium]